MPNPRRLIPLLLAISCTTGETKPPEEEPANTGDAATLSDAGHRMDASTRMDAATGQDAAVTTDAAVAGDAATAVDAATAADAAVREDAGALADAAVLTDAAVPVDAALPTDEATPGDGATPADAAVATDAGATTDAGEPPDSANPIVDVDEDLVSPPEDCDDNNNQIYPGAPDTWYDGIDSNCDRQNDFDADGDSHMPPGAEGALEFFCIAYGIASDLESCFNTFYPDATTAAYVHFGDCAEDDLALPPGSTVTSDQVNPEAVDLPYDGVDANCDLANEFDVDGDSYILAGFQDAFLGYSNHYGFFFPVFPEDDCDDDDPLIHPASMERLGDNTDQDCDGNNDTAPFQNPGFTWTDPGNVVVGRTDNDYVLVTSTDSTSAVAYTSAGLALIFSTADTSLLREFTWHNNSNSPKPTNDAVDMVTVGPNFYPSLQYYNDDVSIQTGYLITKYVYPTAPATYQSKIQYEVFKPEDYYVDVDTSVDADGRLWTVGCGPLSFAVFAAYEDTSVNPVQWSKVGGLCGDDWDDLQGSPTPCVDVDYTGALTCFIQPPQATGANVAQVTLCSGLGCQTFDVDVIADSIQASPSQPYANETWTAVNTQGPLILATDSDGVTLMDGPEVVELLAGYQTRSAEGWKTASGTIYVAAVVDDPLGDGARDIVLVYGDPVGSMQTVVMPFTASGVTYDAESASVVVDNERVFLAASGTHPSGDMVAWLFLGAP